MSDNSIKIILYKKNPLLESSYRVLFRKKEQKMECRNIKENPNRKTK